MTEFSKLNEGETMVSYEQKKFVCVPYKTDQCEMMQIPKES